LKNDENVASKCNKQKTERKKFNLEFGEGTGEFWRPELSSVAIFLIYVAWILYCICHYAQLEEGELGKGKLLSLNNVYY
jgi:hypothetical protein